MNPAEACRACGGMDLEPFYEVRGIPVHSCLMVASRAAALAFPRGDLRLDFCRRCGFVQNGLYDASLQGYSTDYEETQAFSPTFMAFADQLARDQVERHGLSGRTVVEIGCGKGEFLVLLCEHGAARGIGIDPGYRPERTDSPVRERIEFIQDFYSERYAHLTGDYVCCRHTLEHIGPVHDFTALIRRTMRPGTPLFLELPDLERVLVDQAFWDVYYEHCSYFTLGSLARLAQRCGFSVSRLKKEYGDQYLILDGEAVDGPAPLPRTADDLERTIAQVATFKAAIPGKLAALKRRVRGWHEAAETAALWGSGSKAVSFLTTTGLGDAVDAVVDINPHKHGKFMAGTGHEILPPQALRQRHPDHVVVMNPLYVPEITRDLADLGLHPSVSTLEDVRPD